MSEVIEWNFSGNSPNWKTNYRCFLTNRGRWRLEKSVTFGKWVFNVELKPGCPTAPTFADQRNFFSGLLEAEYKNDQYVFMNGEVRPSQFKKKLSMFKHILEEYTKEKGIEGITFNLSYYFKKGGMNEIYQRTKKILKKEFILV